VRGEITEYPEPSLRKIIESDSERYLKISAFRAILNQLKIHPDIIRRESVCG
jgi:hypothetical protein